MDEIKEYLPILIPLLIIQVTLAIISLRHILTHDNYKFGSRKFWIPVVLFIGVIGPTMYFQFGREDE